MKARLNLLWLQSGGCGGCTMSLLGADTRDLFASIEAAGIDLLWHPALSETTGQDVLRLLEDCASGARRLDILCLEGAVMRGPVGSGRFHRLAGSEAPMMQWIERLASVAENVLAIGSCAAYGGIMAGAGCLTEACGLQYEDATPGGLLGPAWRAASGLPVINVAGCPVHPNWVLETLMSLAMGELKSESLDSLARPRLYADQLVHHGCARNEYYEFKASAEKPSDLGCLMEHLGCKGTQAHADCNTRLWNGEGSCTRGGYACISCTEPGFQDPGHPFGETPKIAGIPVGLPTDMPKAWFVALAALSKSATPKRVRENAVADHLVVPPTQKKTGLK